MNFSIIIDIDKDRTKIYELLKLNTITNSLNITNPNLAKEWHLTKNGSLTPNQVSYGSEKKVWWLCSKKPTHEWEAIINSRAQGNGCPYCSNKKICIDNCLTTLNPNLAKEWHPTKNGLLTPYDVTVGSGKRIWWICSKKPTHEWDADIYSRANGIGCPYCSGRLATPENCLANLKNELAKEWHPTKNEGLTPYDVTCNNRKKVWWLCSKGHEWQAVISSRDKGSGCPYCSNKKVCINNCLATVNPGLTKEWHPTKNEGFTPYDVTFGSHKKAYWLCSKGHEWNATINSRNNGNGCPECWKNRRKGTKNN